MAQARSNSSKHVSGKPLSTLLQELIQSSPLGCLSTCEAVRALRRLAPPMLKDMPTICLRKKITDCLTRNPAFDVAQDHLRHGIRPRYALRDTDIAVGGSRFKKLRKLSDPNNGSYAHTIKTGDRILQEAVEGPFNARLQSNLPVARSRRESNAIRNKGQSKHTLDIPVIQTSPTSNYIQSGYHYFPRTLTFPKVNFPDLTSIPFDVITPPEISPPHCSHDIPSWSNFSSSELSPMQDNMFHSPSALSYLNPIQCNLFPYHTPPTSPENTMSYLPHISSDDVMHCLKLV